MRYGAMLMLPSSITVEALRCYEHIILKNTSISVVTVLACKEIVKCGQYELAIHLLGMLRGNEGRSDIQELSRDVSILKLFNIESMA